MCLLLCLCVCVCVFACVCVCAHPVGHLLGLLADLPGLAADEALHGEEGVLGIDHGLALGDLCVCTRGGQFGVGSTRLAGTHTRWVSKKKSQEESSHTR